MTLAPQLLEILVCPKCKGKLDYDADSNTLTCSNDRLRFSIRDGIPIMLIDEAESF